jgi:hypothetical protein
MYLFLWEAVIFQSVFINKFELKINLFLVGQKEGMRESF